MKSGSAGAGTIDEYIAAFPPDVQKILQQVRTTIRKAARQSRWLAIQPPKKTPSAEPIGMPSEKKASARARFAFG